MSALSNVNSLKSAIKKANINAVILLGTDPHLSEYIPDHWQVIKWLSGFTGSYAKMVVTQDKALLWTDSRYFIQAEDQLKNSGIILMRDRQIDSISIENWLINELNSGDVVALDGLTISASGYSQLKMNFAANGISLIEKEGLVDLIWSNRPLVQNSKIYSYPVSFSGQNRIEKLKTIRHLLTSRGAEATLISALDELAWTFNLRGEVHNFSPLFAGYGYVDQKRAILFVSEGQISESLIHELANDGIEVVAYEELIAYLSGHIPKSIYLDSSRINTNLMNVFLDDSIVIEGVSLIAKLKSIKNKIEISGMKAAHRRDGVAMVNFLYWLDRSLGKEKMTEMSIAESLKKFRSQQIRYKGESFSSIVGFGPHGAIVHYNATPNTDIEIRKNGILLIDSGGHYSDGTTDITRTLAIGKVSAKQKKDFTLVLKGMINLANAVYPNGIKGHSLDVLARNSLWQDKLNYGHGTGHGIGHYLSVHEGPMTIRTEINNEPLCVGQILSNEPGLYREGEYGIRIENILLCKSAGENLGISFNSFETLTLCPIDRRLINKSLLNSVELKWINLYHKKVYQTLKSHLNPSVSRWLKSQCNPL
ncbi:MAG: aminopeptidase family protein P [Bacteroidia bacterium]|nr:aminopeptidase family protein P [Bacteroidia bacterium]